MSDRWRTSLQQIDEVDPSADLWARAVARSGEDLPTKLPTTERPHRILAGVIALLVGAVGIGAAFFLLRLGEPSLPGATLTT